MPHEPLLAKAIAYAAEKHMHQYRKYTGVPYILHPIEVAGIVRTVPGATEEMLAAAVLHDVVEDTHATNREVELVFGRRVAELVAELTDVYDKESYPDRNRAERKAAECMRLAGVSPEAQTIKLADLISNSKDIVQYDPGFARKYLAEKEALLEVLVMGDPVLRAKAKAQLQAGYLALAAT